MSPATFKPAFMLLTLFALLAVGARAFGATQPQHSGMEGFNIPCQGRASLCWNDLEPGYTAKYDIASIAEDNGYTGSDITGSFQMRFQAPQRDPGCLFIGYSAGGDESPIAMIMLGCTALSLGDILSGWGMPDEIGLEPAPSLRMYVAYLNPDGRLKAKVALRPSKSLSAYATVDLITLAWRRTIPDDLAHWHGFAPAWRYCQWEATFAACK